MRVSCDSCGRQYQVKQDLAGRTVKCKACDQQFTIPDTEAAPLQNLLGDLPAEPAPPAKTLLAASTNNAAIVEGPPDTTMRLVSGGMVLAGIVLLGVNHAKAVMEDEVYVLPLILGPFALMLGIAGVISPNVVRAAGKYGKHLPLRYKLIAAAVGLVALLACLLLAFVVYR